MNKNCVTSFEDEFFDFTYSYMVFEHIENLSKAVQEMSRITKSSGIGVHVVPGKFRPIEGHLHMPFVYWLPKNSLRNILIQLLILHGIDPKWNIQGKTVREKAEIYYDYTVKNTFYRTRKTIIKEFLNNDFFCKDMVLDHEKFRNSFLNKLNVSVLGRLLEVIIANTKSSILLIEKNGTKWIEKYSGKKFS